MSRLPTLVSLALTVLGCDGAAERSPAPPPASAATDRCSVAVQRIATVTLEAGGAPSDGERAMIDATQALVIDKCRAEGLSEAQAECIATVTDLASFRALGDCPAIATSRPSWLVLPPGPGRPPGAPAPGGAPPGGLPSP